jgi:hypothetical protein
MKFFFSEAIFLGNMQPTQPANQFCYSEIFTKHTGKEEM